MGDEALFKKFQEEYDATETPLWNFLWPSWGLGSEKTFDENLKALLPNEESLQYLKEYFGGKRWHVVELPEEVREFFEFLLLDYRSLPCFFLSKQVYDYLTGIGVDPKKVLHGGFLKNDTSFEFVDTLQKCKEIVGEEVPVGADPVCVLLLRSLYTSEDFYDIFVYDEIELQNVYFHGEYCACYFHKPLDFDGYFGDETFQIPILAALAFSKRHDISAFSKICKEYPWSVASVKVALYWVETQIIDLNHLYFPEPGPSIEKNALLKVKETLWTIDSEIEFDEDEDGKCPFVVDDFVFKDALAKLKEGYQLPMYPDKLEYEEIRDEICDEENKIWELLFGP